MNSARNIIITLTLAAVGLSGAAQSAERGGKNGMRGDGVRVEQRAERRGNRDGATSRNARSEDRRRDHGDSYSRVDRRQDKQRSRIAEGRRSGELSRGEFRRLKKQQRKIGRMERRFYSDGHLSGKERRRLERAQDRASRRIAHFKHNDTYRGSGHRYGRWYRGDRDYGSRHWRH